MLYLALIVCPMVNAKVTRIFGSTADDIHTGNSGDAAKIGIYAGILSGVGGTMVLYFIYKVIVLLQRRRKSVQTVNPVDGYPPYSMIVAEAETDTREASFIEEHKDSSSPHFKESGMANTPISKAKRKVRIKLSKTGTHSMTTTMSEPIGEYL